MFREFPEILLSIVFSKSLCFSCLEFCEFGEHPRKFVENLPPLMKFDEIAGPGFGGTRSPSQVTHSSIIEIISAFRSSVSVGERLNLS